MNHFNRTWQYVMGVCEMCEPHFCRYVTITGKRTVSMSLRLNTLFTTKLCESENYLLYNNLSTL